MVDVRCKNFDDYVWAYVAENARLRKISRCKALELIIIEHMKFMNKIQEGKIKAK